MWIYQILCLYISYYVYIFDIMWHKQQIEWRFRYLTDISNWTKKVNQLDIEERKLYFDNILANEEYLTAETIYQVRNMFIPALEFMWIYVNICA